jgi:cardiolipin synthase
MPHPICQRLHLAFWLLIGGLGATGCATLPDTQAILARHSEQAARFEDARGPISERRSAAIVAALKRSAGDIDILDKQLSLEQAINDSPLVLGNKVTLLQNGPATYAAMLKAISGAQDHINMESYIIEDDAMGQVFAQALLAKQRQGVQVNLIYDSVGSLHTAKPFFDELTQAGVAVLEFNPVNPLDSRGGAWLINNRDHRKLLIIDGRTVFLGGINISSVYSSGSVLRRNPKPPKNDGVWRDTDLQIDGPVVADFQKLFLQTWHKQHGETLMAKNYTPTLSAVGSDIVRAIGGTPDDAYNQVYLTLISAISNAEKQMFLTNAYFVPDPQLVQSLINAVARGVDVRLILPSYSDSGLVFHAGRAQYAQLLAGGVQIFERQGALLHAKTAMIDGVWSTVGSSNLDWRSFMDNDEVNAVILGRDFASQMTAAFAIDQAASHPINAQTWAKRPLTLKLKEWLARLWERWL